jgi:hypothetical protein
MFLLIRQQVELFGQQVESVICAFSSRVPATRKRVGRTFTANIRALSLTPPAGASRDPAA